MNYKLTPELEAILEEVCARNEKSVQQIKLIKEIKKEFPKCKQHEHS
jgi:hypothetical protein